MGFDLKNIFRRKAPQTRERLPSEFDLYRRKDEATEKLFAAMKMVERIGENGSRLEKDGYSLGGFTAAIATEDGQKDGVPNINPVTVNVVGKQGEPLFVLTLEEDNFKVSGATPAVQRVLDTMPPGLRDDPAGQINAAIAAMTPDSEVAGSIAYIKDGKLRAANPASRAQAKLENEQRVAEAQRATAEQEMRDIVQDNTVLQVPIKAGSQIKLKTPV